MANLSESRVRPAIRTYLYAIVAFLAALLVRDALTPIVGQLLPHATFMVATAFSAWFLGLGPGLLTMLLGLPAADYFFTPPLHTWSAFTRGELPGTFTYLAASAALIAMGVANRRRADELQQKNLRIEQQAAAVDQTNQQLRELSRRLLHSQDEERRRIARELHDSVGQYLGAIAMVVDGLRNSGANLSSDVLQKLEEASQSVRACSTEVRTISHLLHPPLLEELGLASAARWYVDGFAERSGIQVQMEMPEDLPRLDRDAELVLFRVLQEALTNVHRHSGSKNALVRVACQPQQVSVEVRDYGKGVVAGNRGTIRPGVGIRGMQERVRELAGALEFASDGADTYVKATIPLPAAPLKATPPDAAESPRRRAHSAG